MAVMSLMFLGVTYCLVRGFQLYGTTCRGHLQAPRRYSRNGLTSQKKWKGYSSRLAASCSYTGLQML